MKVADPDFPSGEAIYGWTIVNGYKRTSELTMPPNIYAICLTRNEDDIIEMTLKHAAKFCKQVFVLDNGSTDATWEIIKNLHDSEPRIVPFEQKPCRYGIGLRGYIFNRVRSHFKNGDWILLLDSDEFLETDPHGIITYCNRKNLDLVYALQAQFYLTDADLEKDWCLKGRSRITTFADLPRRYLKNWKEPRLFRYHESLTWPDMDAQGNPTQFSKPKGLKQKCKKLVVNRHYQYRSLPQIRQRLENRSKVHDATGRFRHNANPDINDYIMDSRKLKCIESGETITIGIMDYLHLFFIRKSKRYKDMAQRRKKAQIRQL